MLVGLVFDEPMTSTPATPTDLKTSGARIYAREVIKAVPLKAPSTAEYARPSVKPDAKDPNQFQVSSYIDSQNGFGAMIRTYWRMRLRYSGSDAAQDIDRPGNWTIEEFIFDGDKIK